VGTAHSLMERYAQAMEALDTVRLAHEEIRELLTEHFDENARWADKLSERMDRVERYTILSKFGNISATQQIEGEVGQEHIERTLREELVSQQGLIETYQRNLNRVKLRMARMGETTALLNEADDWLDKVAKAEEVIKRIREELNGTG